MTTVHAATKDAVFQASIEFIGTLTGMTPPPIEIAPAETFKPFVDFTNRVCEIFEKQIVEALTAERDIAVRKLAALSNAHALKDLYQAGLDQERGITSLTAERDEWKARCEFSFKQRNKLTKERDAAREAVISNCARVMTVTAERDALKDAARLALDALECSEAYVGCESWSPSMLREVQGTIAALKAVL